MSATLTSNSPVLGSPIQLYDLHPPLEDLRAEVLRGLSQPQKSISPKFLYDKQGAELFDAICTLDEYYLTRTEMAILTTHAQEIADWIGDGALIEFGSGSSQKIRVLFDAMASLPTYVALDISKQHLQESCADLVNVYPNLLAIAICTDYTQSFELPAIPAIADQRRVGFFPGSSIGNLEPDEAVEFLKNVAGVLGANGRLLVGVDLKKSTAILEPAYDDAQRVSAAFAMNLLARINRELGADFDLNQFHYRAFYNPIGRIEMGLVSHIDQTIHFDGVEIPFRQGETLRTEYSYKYNLVEFQQLAEQAGFQTKAIWTDPQQWFSVYGLEVMPPSLRQTPD
ncbi:L-histidine N(alpha)-methyltransferase [Oscillatoria sp. FACHB-1407]|uniref:L-histidine N(alpha)-methyltransferase n=1 Tax=Oscillatoria sp. FACHB-1407 TaxID=2692847 RepID=UPI0016891A3E|nr:L-histidine N(alpha)-methyltransferase [Oscillatoria sp. FACHB-1407]MBD2459482.1 L-histidine N(alpha)-methyltransferase [Oscillatoria sp. FACHB-1407]